MGGAGEGVLSVGGKAVGHDALLLLDLGAYARDGTSAPSLVQTWVSSCVPQRPNSSNRLGPVRRVARARRRFAVEGTRAGASITYRRSPMHGRGTYECDISIRIDDTRTNAHSLRPRVCLGWAARQASEEKARNGPLDDSLVVPANLLAAGQQSLRGPHCNGVVSIDVAEVINWWWSRRSCLNGGRRQ